MNVNEECLLLFLKNPGRIDKTTEKLIFSLNVLSKESNLIDFPITDFSSSQEKKKSS